MCIEAGRFCLCLPSKHSRTLSDLRRTDGGGYSTLTVIPTPTSVLGRPGQKELESPCLLAVCSPLPVHPGSSTRTGTFTRRATGVPHPGSSPDPNLSSVFFYPRHERGARNRTGVPDESLRRETPTTPILQQEIIHIYSWTPSPKGFTPPSVLPYRYYAHESAGSDSTKTSQTQPTRTERKPRSLLDVPTKGPSTEACSHPTKLFKTVNKRKMTVTVLENHRWRNI